MLLSFKSIIITIGLVFILWIGWAWGNGYLTYQKVDYKCLNGTGYYAAVEKQQWFSLGRFHFYYQPYTWGCDKDHQYDPNAYHVENGVLVGN